MPVNASVKHTLLCQLNNCVKLLIEISTKMKICLISCEPTSISGFFKRYWKLVFSENMIKEQASFFTSVLTQVLAHSFKVVGFLRVDPVCYYILHIAISCVVLWILSIIGPKESWFVQTLPPLIHNMILTKELLSVTFVLLFLSFHDV